MLVNIVIITPQLSQSMRMLKCNYKIYHSFMGNTHKNSGSSQTYCYPDTYGWNEIGSHVRRHILDIEYNYVDAKHETNEPEYPQLTLKSSIICRTVWWYLTCVFLIQQHIPNFQHIK
eukprot:510627_1